MIRLEPGATATLATLPGAGIIRHIWCTMGHNDPMHRRNVILRMFWDGDETPSVECPVGDFFGQGWGESYNYAALPLAAGPRNGLGLNCYFPMPFSQGAILTVENDSDEPCGTFYYYIDYEELDQAPDDMGRFHAFWSRSYQAPPEDVENECGIFYPPHPNLTDTFNHPILDAEGQGHVVGINYYVDCPTPMWYGEGDDMFFIDGEPWPPSLHGTGTEDYFNCSLCPREVYSHPYFGYPRINNDTGFLGRTHCYRFHIEDPVVFRRSLRGSIERGHADALALDLITVAYWYQTLPHKPLPPLPGREGRKNRPPITGTCIHRWREAWRQTLGGGLLWGDEPFPESFNRKLQAKAAKGKKKTAPEKNVRIAAQEQEKQAKALAARRKRKRKKT